MSKRRLARENCLQSLYVTGIGAYGCDSVLASFQMTDFVLEEETFNFYKELFFAAVSNLEKIDSIIRSTSTNWDINRMPATDRSILRMAVCEMMILRDTPAPVIIDEAIELAKKYSTENSGKFINGVLDSVAKSNSLIKSSFEISPQCPRGADTVGTGLTAHTGSAKTPKVKTARRPRSAAKPQPRTAPGRMTAPEATGTPESEARGKPESLKAPSQRPLAHKTAKPVAGRTRRKGRRPQSGF